MRRMAQVDFKFKAVKNSVDELVSAVDKGDKNKSAHELEVLDWELKRQHPAINELVESISVGENVQKRFQQQSEDITRKLKTLVKTWPDALPQTLKNKSTQLRERQETFQALMNFELMFGPKRNSGN